MRVFDKEVSFIDLCAGIGGFHIALNSYNAKCIFVSEVDKYAIETYKHNHLNGSRETDILEGDINDVRLDEIPNHDILCAGFPCQPFSISGNQQGFKDSRGNIFFRIEEIINYHNPSIVLLENVSNLSKHDEGKTLSYMKEALEDLGYNVYYDILNASDFGVPQARKRIYFVAFKKYLGVTDFKFPEKIVSNIRLADIIQDESEIDEYFYIERPDIYMKDEESIAKLEARKHNEPIRIGTINKGGQGDRIYSINGHAITLSAQGGGSGAKTGAYFVNGRVRRLTPKECLRVQGFPEKFTFPETVSLAQQYKQLGNTIAIPVLDSIIKNICELKELESITVENEIIEHEENLETIQFTIKKDIR